MLSVSCTSLRHCVKLCGVDWCRDGWHVNCLLGMNLAANSREVCNIQSMHLPVACAIRTC